MKVVCNIRHRLRQHWNVAASIRLSSSHLGQQVASVRSPPLDVAPGSSFGTPCPSSCLSRLMRPSLASSMAVVTPHRAFTTAYQGIPSDGKHNHHLLAHLIPYRCTLKDGRRVEVDFFRQSVDSEEDEWYVGMALMNLVIRDGRSWPFEDEFTTVEGWRGYFLSHTAFVVRALEHGMDARGRNSSSRGEILGCFYIKPNFPGRCSHICNGGFITAPQFRGLGIGTLMGRVFLRAAKDLGYKSRWVDSNSWSKPFFRQDANYWDATLLLNGSSYFNLVFKSNVSSVTLWERLGFERVATLENAARLEGLEDGSFDTAFGYRYDLDKLPADHLGLESAEIW